MPGWADFLVLYFISIVLLFTRRLLYHSCIDIELVFTDTCSVETCGVDAESGLLLTVASLWIRSLLVDQEIIITAQGILIMVLESCQISSLVAIWLL